MLCNPGIAFGAYYGWLVVDIIGFCRETQFSDKNYPERSEGSQLSICNHIVKILRLKPQDRFCRVSRQNLIRFIWAIGLISAQSDALPRVITLSPQATETLFQVGKEASIVAVSPFSDYPQAATKLPRLSFFITPHIERVAAVLPDWVISNEGVTSSDFDNALTSFGLRHFRQDISTVKSLFSETRRMLQQVFGEASNPFLEAQEHCWRTRQFWARPFSFLLFVSLKPPIVFGHDTFLSDLITQFGGKNVLSQQLKLKYPQISFEWLVNQKIDRLFFMEDSFQTLSDAKATIPSWWNYHPELVPLPTRYFSRASFTPLGHLGALVGNNNYALDCH